MSYAILYHALLNELVWSFPYCFNPFVPNARCFSPLKTENRKAVWRFQGVGKGRIGKNELILVYAGFKVFDYMLKIGICENIF